MKHLNLYFWQRAIIFWFLILWVEYLEGLKIKSIKYQVWSYSSSILIVFVTHMMNLACECEWFMSHNWLIILIIADFLDWPWENVFDPLIYLWCHKILQFLQNTEYFFSIYLLHSVGTGMEISKCFPIQHRSQEPWRKTGLESPMSSLRHSPHQLLMIFWTQPSQRRVHWKMHWFSQLGKG